MISNYKRFSKSILVCSIVLLIIFIFQDYAMAAGYDDNKFGKVCKSSLDYLYGGFGALISAIAGVAAIIASAVGGFRMAWALLVVSVGSFIVQSYMEIWFGTGICN